MNTRVILTIIVLALLIWGASEWRRDGPVERAGERVDNVVDDITGKGPAERAGEVIDDTIKGK